jgi:transposase
MILSAGNIADCSAFEPLYEELDGDNVLEAAALDKGYDADAIRDHLLQDGINPVIPPKSNRKTPIPYDREVYRERNRVERFFNKLKQFRRIATRYEKLHWTFMAFVHLATALISLRNS